MFTAQLRVPNTLTGEHPTPRHVFKSESFIGRELFSSGRSFHIIKGNCSKQNMWAFLLLVGCAALAGTTTGEMYQIRVERAALPASPPKSGGRPSQPAPQPPKPQPQPNRPAVRPPSGPQIQPPKPPTGPQVQPPKPHNRPGRSPQTRDVPLTRPAPLPYLPEPQVRPALPANPPTGHRPRPVREAQPDPQRRPGQTRPVPLIAPAPPRPGFGGPPGNIRRARQTYDEPSFVQLSPEFTEEFA